MSGLLQLDNERFSKRTCTWLRETVIDAELSAPRIPVQKMIRRTLRGCCYNEKPSDVYGSGVAISMSKRYLKGRISPSDKKLIAHMDESLLRLKMRKSWRWTMESSQTPLSRAKVRLGSKSNDDGALHSVPFNREE
jgi:hypothetical protein